MAGILILWWSLIFDHCSSYIQSSLVQNVILFQDGTLEMFDYIPFIPGENDFRCNCCQKRWWGVIFLQNKNSLCVQNLTQMSGRASQSCGLQLIPWFHAAWFSWILMQLCLFWLFVRNLIINSKALGFSQQQRLTIQHFVLLFSKWIFQNI